MATHLSSTKALGTVVSDHMRATGKAAGVGNMDTIFYHDII